MAQKLESYAHYGPVMYARPFSAMKKVTLIDYLILKFETFENPFETPISDLEEFDSPNLDELNLSLTENLLTAIKSRELVKNYFNSRKNLTSLFPTTLESYFPSLNLREFNEEGEIRYDEISERDIH